MKAPGHRAGGRARHPQARSAEGHREKGPDGKTIRDDEAKELAGRTGSVRAYVVDVLARMELHRRDGAISGTTRASGKTALAWLKDTFEWVNTGEAARVLRAVNLWRDRTGEAGLPRRSSRRSRERRRPARRSSCRSDERRRVERHPGRVLR